MDQGLIDCMAAREITLVDKVSFEKCVLTAMLLGVITMLSLRTFLAVSRQRDSVLVISMRERAGA